VIGDSFGGRDHSTVITHLKAVQDLMDTDNLFKDTVKQLVKKVQSAFTNLMTSIQFLLKNIVYLCALKILK
jgi:hypothetical protein